MIQQYMMCNLKSLQWLDNIPQDNLNNWLKMPTMNMLPINNLNRLLMKQQNMFQLHKRPSLLSDPWWHNMTQQYTMCNLKSLKSLGKFLLNNWNKRLPRRPSKNLEHKNPSLQSDPWWRSMIRQCMVCKLLTL